MRRSSQKGFHVLKGFYILIKFISNNNFPIILQLIAEDKLKIVFKLMEISL